MKFDLLREDINNLAHENSRMYFAVEKLKSSQENE